MLQWWLYVFITSLLFAKSYCKWLKHVLIWWFSVSFFSFMKMLAQDELEITWIEDIFIHCKITWNKESSPNISLSDVMLTHNGSQALVTSFCRDRMIRPFQEMHGIAHAHFQTLSAFRKVINCTDKSFD